MSTTRKENDLKNWSGQEFLYSKFLYYMKTGRPSVPLYIKRLYLLKSFFALCLYGFAGKKGKIAYWRERREVVRSVYGRYLSFVDGSRAEEVL